MVHASQANPCLHPIQHCWKRCSQEEQACTVSTWNFQIVLVITVLNLLRTYDTIIETLVPKQWGYQPPSSILLPYFCLFLSHSCHSLTEMLCWSTKKIPQLVPFLITRLVLFILVNADQIMPLILFT